MEAVNAIQWGCGRVAREVIGATITEGVRVNASYRS